MHRYLATIGAAVVVAACVNDVPVCLAFVLPTLPGTTTATSAGGKQHGMLAKTPPSPRLRRLSHHGSPPRSTTTSRMASEKASTAGSQASIDNGTRTIVVVGLNGALQRTIVFEPPKGLKVGDVNRASSVGAGIGGKGQNVCVALTKLAEGTAGGDAGVDVTLAHFAGGKSGESVCENLTGLGVKLVTSETAAEMRLCTSLVDERFGETTEIIEPWSAEITADEKQDLLTQCKATFGDLPRIDGMAVMGSLPVGVGPQTLEEIMDAVSGSAGFKGAETRMLVDSVVGFKALVGTGHIGLLKVNAEEVVSLAESGRESEQGDAEGAGVSVWMEDKLGLAAAELFQRHGEKLPWIAVTNGRLPAYLFSREYLQDGKMNSFWRLSPAPVDAINPIGAGDAVAAGTLYEWTRGSSIPEAFRRGLSVGGASCISRDPLCNSCFSMEEADRLLPDVRLEHIQRKDT